MIDKWVTVAGTHLCIDSTPFPLFMGSVYTGLDDPRRACGQAVALGLNTIRVTNFLDENGTPGGSAGDEFDEARWVKVDEMVAAAGDAGLRVLLDLSTYRNMLKNCGAPTSNPYAVDWAPFLVFVASRINTVTGRIYSSDPTIPFVSFAGEVDAVNGGDNTYGLTTSQLTAFFATVTATYHALAPRQILSSGGLMQLDWGSGIDYAAIFSLSHNQLCSMHAYSSGDVSTSLPLVAAYAAGIGKPWLLEEFGYDATHTDSARAAYFASVFGAAASHCAAGVGLWNVGVATTSTFDVGPQFPDTYAAVRAASPLIS